MIATKLFRLPRNPLSSLALSEEHPDYLSIKGHAIAMRYQQRSFAHSCWMRFDGTGNRWLRNRQRLSQVTNGHRYAHVAQRFALDSYTPFTRSSKHPANAFKIHVHDVCSNCSTFAWRLLHICLTFARYLLDDCLTV